VKKRIINAWCMYDWANSAFATTVMAALFPPFYRAMAGRAGLSSSRATAAWAYTAAAALLIIAVSAPVLGAAADYTGRRKRYMACFVGTGILATAACAILKTDAWLTASLVFIAGNVGFAGANIFYESLLPHIAAKSDLDRISSKGYALGYIGGGILMAVNACWVMRPHMFGMPDADFAVRASFVSVALWWAVFSWPLFRHVPDPPGEKRNGTTGNPLREGFTRVVGTLKELTRYRQLAVFLLAFWIYNDGISTIIKMATAYGDEIGIRLTHMVAALILTQFVGVPFTFLFGAMAGRLGAKRSLLVALAVYALISVMGFFMRTALHFYALAVMVGMVQGGSQALSRSLFAAMVPRHRATEFFGFFSTGAKFAGIVGPLLFGILSQVTGHSRFSIISLIVFFVVGAVLLCLVDEREGMRTARAAEAARADRT